MPRSEVPEPFFPFAHQPLGALGDDVFPPDVAAEGHERALVVGLDLALGGLPLPHARQPLENVRVRTGVVVHGEKHEVVVVVGGEEHEVLVVGTHFLQHFRLHPRVHELRVAHLEDARQPQAHLVDELGAFHSARLGHDHLHSVGGLHGLVGRRALGAEKLLAPGLLAVGAAAVKDPNVAGVGAVLVEVEPVVVEVPGTLHQPLPAVVHQRGIVGERRRIVGVGAHVGEEQPSEGTDRVGWMPYLGAEGALRGLGRLLQAVARDVVKPAVVGAADAALFDVAVLKRRPRWEQAWPMSPNRPWPSRKSTRSSPRTRTAWGTSCNSASVPTASQ